MTQLAEKLENVVPGVYPGLSYAEYVERLPGVRSSDLAEMKRSPAHCRAALTRPKESTKELAFGHAFHTYVLEPERFETQYAIIPNVDRRYKAGKEMWADFERQNPTATLLTNEDCAHFVGMQQALLAHAVAKDLLRGPGAAELSMVWDDPETTLPCKGRIDRVASYGGWTWIADLKTCRDAREKEFSKDVGRYSYNRALAFYRWGLNILRPAQRRCCFIAVEKEPPYGVVVHELDERALEQGEREFRSYLNLYAECVKSGSWPAYGDGMTLIDLPPWNVDRIE